MCSGQKEFAHCIVLLFFFFVVAGVILTKICVKRKIKRGSRKERRRSQKTKMN